MTSIGKFVYMAQYFILLRLNPFGLRVDRELWWFEHSMSKLRVYFSTDHAKNVSWFWVSPLREWSGLTMASTEIVVCAAHHFVLLWLNPFGLRVDSEGYWFEDSMS